MLTHPDHEEILRFLGDNHNKINRTEELNPFENDVANVISSMFIYEMNHSNTSNQASKNKRHGI